jgi:hypothetical protein
MKIAKNVCCNNIMTVVWLPYGKDCQTSLPLNIATGYETGIGEICSDGHVNNYKSLTLWDLDEFGNPFYS